MTVVSLQKCVECDNRLLKDAIIDGIEQSGFDLSDLKERRVCRREN